MSFQPNNFSTRIIDANVKASNVSVNIINSTGLVCFTPNGYTLKKNKMNLTNHIKPINE
jgi:hypothetical protein